jgi:hypothetical protein
MTRMPNQHRTAEPVLLGEATAAQVTARLDPTIGLLHIDIGLLHIDQTAAPASPPDLIKEFTHRSSTGSACAARSG